MLVERPSEVSGTGVDRQPLDIHQRWMIRRDLPAVLAIGAASFEYPWTEADFVTCLGRRNCIGFVAECGERVVGFMVYELHDWKFDVLNFAVLPAYRRRGVGRHLAGKLTGRLSSDRRTRVSALVKESNLPAQLFWRACGFRAVAVSRGCYEGTDEAGYLFAYDLRDQ